MSIPVQDPVVLMLNVRFTTIIPFADVSKGLKEILMSIVNPLKIVSC